MIKNPEGSGVPVNGASAVHTVTISAFAACVLTLTIQGRKASVTFAGNEANSAISAAVASALNALPNIETGDVTVATTGTTNRAIAITFAGNLQRLAIPVTTATISGVAGATVAVVETTAGVTATARGSDKGSRYINTATGYHYLNTGTALAPTWQQLAFA